MNAFGIIAWSILIIEVIVLVYVLFWIKRAFQKAKASLPEHIPDEYGIPYYYFTGQFNPHINLDLTLIRTPHLRIGLPRLNFSKHIQWTIIWW